MADLPTHRNEYTGSAVLDRIQSNVRALLEYVRVWVPALARANGVGLARVHLTAANYTGYTLTAAEAACSVIRLEGDIPAAGRIILPSADDATGYVRWIVNVTGGGFAVTVATAEGSASLATATTRAFSLSADGPAYLT